MISLVITLCTGFSKMHVQQSQLPSHLVQCGMHLHAFGLFILGALMVIRDDGPRTPKPMTLWVNGTCGACTVLGVA